MNIIIITISITAATRLFVYASRDIVLLIKSIIYLYVCYNNSITDAIRLRRGFLMSSIFRQTASLNPRVSVPAIIVTLAVVVDVT